MFGRVAEWLKAHDWKSCGLNAHVGSNPTPSADGRSPAPDGLGFEPRVEAAGFALASPSGRLAPDLGCESHPVR